jgi:hypothetical protein
LVLAEHLNKFSKEKLIDWICEFIEVIEKDLSYIKLNVISQARITATHFMS